MHKQSTKYRYRQTGVNYAVFASEAKVNGPPQRILQLLPQNLKDHAHIPLFHLPIKDSHTQAVYLAAFFNCDEAGRYIYSLYILDFSC